MKKQTTLSDKTLESIKQVAALHKSLCNELSNLGNSIRTDTDDLISLCYHEPIVLQLFHDKSIGSKQDALDTLVSIADNNEVSTGHKHDDYTAFNLTIVNVPVIILLEDEATDESDDTGEEL